MLYTSTRGKTDMVCSAHAIVQGLADDGGLFMPQNFTPLTMTEICAIREQSYTERAVTILSHFLTDFTDEELRECVESAYTKEKFGEFPVPLHPITDKLAVLELWHGPTSAFKDMALQLLPLLMTKSLKKTGERQKVVILVATSGDTGKAALAGFADVPDTEIIVFYPDGGVSPIQRKQMVTQAGANVHVVAVQGNFDDAQSRVKAILSNPELNALVADNGYTFSSANSINWGRLVPQIVYYFSAYADAVKSGKVAVSAPVNFVVPTGNFGDILAGFFAKMMGLPVKKFICASNANNVLTDFVNTGVYNRERPFHKTSSPSMDILVSSNLERLLYLETDKNTAKVAGWMQELQEQGSYTVDRSVQNNILKDFFATWVDEIETKETIYTVYKNHKYLLDPHTAVAWKALEKYWLLTSDDTYSIVLSTASPFKFNDCVLGAINPAAAADNKEAFASLHALADTTGNPLPPNLAALEHMPELHNLSIPKEEMEATIKSILGVK